MAPKRPFNGVTALRLAGLKRRNDARKLLESKDPNHARGAAYLAGYAIECKLKALALEVFRCWTLEQLAAKWDVSDRDVYSHGLEAFARRLPLWQRFRRGPAWKAFAGKVNAWRPSWRYDHRNWTVEEAQKFLRAVDDVYEWLEVNR